MTDVDLPSNNHTRGGHRRAALVAVFVMATVIAVDQTTKAIALSRLTLGEPIPVIGTLEWELVYNRGSAFGLGQNFGRITGVFASIVAVTVLVTAWRAGRIPQAVVLGMVAGGALGNVLDRLFRVGNCPGGTCTGFMGGAVIDFIDLNFWPVFNVADMMIVIGVLVIGISAFFGGRAVATD